MSTQVVDVAERMTLTRILDAPREVVWSAWTEPACVAKWWGPAGFTSTVCRIDPRAGGRFLYGMKAPDGQQFWTGGEYREVVPHERIVFSMYFADAEGNRVDPAEIGIEHRAVEDAPDVVLFEDAGGGQTRLVYTGNELMQDAVASGQFEAMRQSFEALAAVVEALKTQGECVG